MKMFKGRSGLVQQKERERVNSQRIQKIKDLTCEITEEIFKDANGVFFGTLGNIFESVDSGIKIVDTDCNIIYINPKAKELAEIGGEEVKKYIYCKEISNEEMCEKCMIKVAIKNRKVTIFEYEFGEDPYIVICLPLIHNGLSGIIQIMEKMNARLG